MENIISEYATSLLVYNRKKDEKAMAGYKEGFASIFINTAIFIIKIFFWFAYKQYLSNDRRIPYFF